jgi:DNA invertase Pin-like site-specific DNA recombinase
MRPTAELPAPDKTRLATAQRRAEELRERADYVLWREIRRLVEQEYPQAAIARELGLTRSAISFGLRAGKGIRQLDG